MEVVNKGVVVDVVTTFFSLNVGSSWAQIFLNKRVPELRVSLIIDWFLLTLSYLSLFLILTIHLRKRKTGANEDIQLCDQSLFFLSFYSPFWPNFLSEGNEICKVDFHIIFRQSQRQLLFFQNFCKYNLKALHRTPFKIKHMNSTQIRISESYGDTFCF